MPVEDKTRLSESLMRLLNGEKSELHLVVEFVLDFFKRCESREMLSISRRREDSGENHSTNAEYNGTDEGKAPNIFSGESIEDRKSIFQAHVAQIASKMEVCLDIICPKLSL